MRTRKLCGCYSLALVVLKASIAMVIAVAIGNQHEGVLASRIVALTTCRTSAARDDSPLIDNLSIKKRQRCRP